MDLTETRDLRGGDPCWVADETNTATSDPLPSGEVEIAIVGAGIMGTMLADRLTDQGHEVLLVDRRPPAHGATAASTALVMWGADVPLTHLAAQIGEEEAARRWRRVFRANRDLARRIDEHGLDCGRADRPELYLAGKLLDETGLREEAAMRQRVGLPSRYLSADEVAARFGLVPRAALLSEGSFGVDPVALSLALLARARRRGARAHFPLDIAALDQGPAGTILRGRDGTEIRARTVILATGYERARWFLPEAFSILSSYAIATEAGQPAPWREHAMIWEASASYLYARTTPDGRIIAGGEDEAFTDGDRRDALIGEKAGLIQARLAALSGAPLTLDCGWSASFGASPDGLPAIGRVPDRDPLWLAYGFGGNGVTFAALGAEIIAAALAGTPDPDAGCFDPYRFG